MTTPEAIQEQIEQLNQDQEYGVFKLYKAISKHVSYAGRKNAEFIGIDVRKGDCGAEAIVEYTGDPMSNEDVQELLTVPRSAVDPLAGADEYHITTTDAERTLYGNRIGEETMITERPPRPWESGTRWEIRGIPVAEGFLNHMTESQLREKALLDYGDEPDQVTIHVDEE
jgi:hypothetical protein